MTLTPDGAAMRAKMSVMDGQYEMAGTGDEAGARRAAAARGRRGGGRGARQRGHRFLAEAAITSPRTPAEEATGSCSRPGTGMELIAADPDVISPTLIEFDGNGRMYVGEMISYMMDADATREHDPISRISRWESTKGDGHYDKHTVFADTWWRRA